MKKYDTSAITALSQAPMKSTTIDFLQDAYKEQLESLLACNVASLGLTYSKTTPYYLYGRYALSGGYYVYTDGAISYNGELFTVASQSAVYTGGTTHYAVIGTASYSPTADPTTYSDLTVHNVHQLRGITMQWTFAPPADSIDLTNVVLLQNVPAKTTQAQGYKVISIAGATGSYSSGSIGFDYGADTIILNNQWSNNIFATSSVNKIQVKYAGKYRVTQQANIDFTSIAASQSSILITNSCGSGASIANYTDFTVANLWEKKKYLSANKIVTCIANDTWDITCVIIGTGPTPTITGTSIYVWFSLEYISP